MLILSAFPFSQGDSGGPLLYKDTDEDEAPGAFRVIGLTSWGFSCAGGEPGVWARVPYANNWITDKITKN